MHVVPRNRKDGLRGFFWPRTRYADDAAAEGVAATLRTALAEIDAGTAGIDAAGAETESGAEGVEEPTDA